MKRNIAALIFLMLCSCTKIINVNLNNTSPQVVIQGKVTNQPGPYTVAISQTINFSDDNIFPPVSGAVVIISDSTAGLTDTCSETSPGIYSTHIIQGVPGHTYMLYVQTGEKTYTATSVMPQLVPLDSVSFNQSNDRFDAGKNKIIAVANFQDPAGIPNYYLFMLYINGQLYTNNFFTFSDRLSDGRYINRQLIDSTMINAGDTVMVQMNNVDQRVYNYFNTLQNAANANTSTSPSNPLSNISNGALGYFSAASVSAKTAVAPQ